MEQLLFRFNPWWEEDISHNFVQRNTYLDQMEKLLKRKNIVILTGLRRIGKTTLIKLFIERMIKNYKIEPRHIFYVSLDAYGLEHYSIMEIIDEYRKIHKLSFSKEIYLFLDEVAYRDAFQQELKNLYDLGNVKIYASSSSSSVLKDRKAFLTGREKIIELLPLTFEEFLVFKGIKIGKADSHLVDVYFEEYMQTGGVPEYVLTGDINYLAELLDDIIYKDIIAAHGIKDKKIIRDYFRLLMERAGKQLSLNKIAKVLDIGVDTARRFLSYFETTYLIYTVERCGKLNERLKSPKKIYAGDVGIKNIFTGFRDKGAVFENLVYLKIKHTNPCYFYKDGVEIDFFTEANTLIETKYNSALLGKQKKVFDSTSAEKKLVIKNVQNFMELP
ncbi:MAG: ATP-binding protein [Deltaproteobacteria bacterium]|nr:ATP-binding protein [Deltaproteobacteria bacterium]